ncbi:hypothetical protein GCM10010124_28970 [Pilimelia terevasa]|uniref:Uncharacterized protein n=1 Tax=Pilimelia terevasa TaxID=53372 RepID=A0A8J3BPX0_9ACTN|nr:hypothetical protein [Pilimelia terevasa]GGK34542.1 hypothetical protein GCM10010124_28970 [Pilimelia terevasa]
MRVRWLDAVMVAVTAAGVLAAAPAQAAPSTAPAAAGTRAMWLWSDAPAGEVVDWAVAAGVRDVFVSVTGRPAGAELARLRALADLAGTADVRLYALGGDPGWVDDRRGALGWLRAAAGTGLFAGYHVDVEPYLLPEWSTDREGVAARYLSLLAALQREAALPLEADVPFWWGEVSVAGRNLAAETLRRVDAATVMSYRNTATGPNSMWDVGGDLLAHGARAGKPVRLAAETGPTAGCGHCSFAGRPAADLDATLAAVDAAALAAPAPAFAGIAVHHYDAWRRLA